DSRRSAAARGAGARPTARRFRATDAADRRRLLPRQQRAGRHELHRDPDRGRAAQPVRAWLHARTARWQAPQAGGPREAAEAEGPGAPVVSVRTGQSRRERYSMRRAQLVVAAGLLLGSTGTAQTPYRGRADLVSLYATVTGAAGRLVTDLSESDFEVRDSGKVQTLSHFSNDLQPITIIVMLDRSGSMEKNFGLVQD